MFPRENGASGRPHRSEAAPRARFAAALVALVTCGELAGCAQVVRQGGFDDVQKAVAERGVEGSIEWRDDSEMTDVPVDGAVDVILARDLTPDSAVQVALLNSPSLQAEYEDLGIAQAELVQAGLPKNPDLIGTTLFGGVSPAYDFDIAESFLDALLIPARKRIAGSAFDEARLRVAGEVFDLAARVRAAYYRLQGAEQLVLVLTEAADAAAASAEFAERLQAAGNASDLDVATERALLAEVRAALLRAEADTVAPREDLRHLLGLSDSARSWKVPPTLPGLPPREPGLDELRELAKLERLELAAAQKESEVIAETLETARDWRWFGRIEPGAAVHREQGENNWIAGPSLSLEIPVFDQRQAEIASLEARQRQSRRRVEALTLEVVADVRRAWEELRAARSLAEHLLRSLIPARERVVELSQHHYDFMLLGTFDLLLAKREEIGAYRDYVEAVRDYWTRVAELEKAVGTRVGIRPPEEGAVPPRAATDASRSHAHHHAPPPVAPPHAGHEHGGH
jgi:outer membrane protein, heavy metal efflux system